MSDYLQQHYSINSFDDSDNWIILNKIETSIKAKIEHVGVPLNKWNIAINYGIKTGYNNAFIIDKTTRNTLIKADPNSAELIRPILRGKDINKYTYNFANLWIIFIPCGFTNKNRKGNDPEKWFKNTYPGIYSFLTNIEKQLSATRAKKSKGLYKRDDQGDYWWELRSCKYMDYFYEQNIAWQRITHENTFCLTSKNMVVLDSMAFINGAKEKTYYLLAILNSSIIKFWIKKNVPEYGNTGYRLSNQFVEQIPIPLSPKPELIDCINKIVVQIINNKTICSEEIDEIVFDLYGLNQDEKNYIKTKQYLKI